jgi:signal transduction histidine kinase/CheY-like chemotaxis protein
MRWLPAVLALAVFAYALLAAWRLAPSAPAGFSLGPLHVDLAVLAIAPVAISAACSWLLVREMHARAEELRRANAAAREGARAKALSLGAMGHEMRNALSAMAGFSDLLAKSGLTPAQAEHLASLRDCNAHLLSVVDGMLEHGRLEAGRVVLHESAFDVDGLVRASLKPIALAAARKGVALEFEDSGVGRVQGDATRVRQVLLNLLSNAVKFTERGTVTVAVAVAPAPEGRRTLRIEVRDTGVGIQPHDVARLFRPFSQVGRPDPTGTGLGLAISRQLCRRMGGDLTVASQPGKGSTFTATLRVRAPPPVAVTLREAARPAPTQLSILLVEDNAMNQRLALKVLEGLGHTAAVATDGAQAVAMAGRAAYDVILMDVRMPVLGGLEATRALRALPQGARPFIIGLTADALPEDRARCLESGMDAHIVKPIEGGRLSFLLGFARQRAEGTPAQGAGARVSPQTGAL